MKAAGRKVPDPPPEPQLMEEAVWIWRAFNDLSSRRLVLADTGPQPIQFSEIAAYAAYHGIVGHDDMDDLRDFVTMLDWMWLENAHEKRAAANKKARAEAEKRTRQSRARRR